MGRSDDTGCASYKQDHMSQVPALKLLVDLGYTFIDQDEVDKILS